MTLVWNPRTGKAEADLRLNGRKRLHVSLKTKKVGEANDRYAAVKAAYREGNKDIEDALRGRKISIESMVRVHQSKKPFETLLETSQWPTLQQAADDYIKGMGQTDKSENTKTTATWHLNSAVKYFGGDRRIDSISHEDVELWKETMLSRLVAGKNVEKATVSPSTVRDSMVRLNALFSWLKRREERRAAREKRSPRLLPTPVDREIIPKGSVPRQRFLSTEEAQRLLASTPDSLKFPVMAGLLGGLRIGEVCTLRPPPQDLNFEIAGGGIILVQEKALVGGGSWRPKSKKRREVPIATELLPIAKHHVSEFSSSTWMVPASEDPERPMSRSTLGNMFMRIVADAGLIAGRKNPVGITFHTLRHTFASWLVMAGVDLWTVAQLLGHSTIKQVEDTYGHLSPNHKRLAMDRLGQSYQLGLDVTTEGE